ncbi:MAG TPA: glycosyltransferase family 4 protein [Candidatus Saccharimonadales bacterium]|nr:glycosyltransferase family 4 protein [Candidatus Saccharimonadales bacterium]
MKLMMVTPYYYPKHGGLEEFARNLGLALAQLQHWDVVVVTSNHEGRRTTTETLDGMTIHRLGRWFKLSNTPLNPLWPFIMRGLIRREKPDLIIAHTPVPSLADAVALAAGRTPLIITYHASTLRKGDVPLFNALATLYGWYERLTLGRALRIFAVSEYVRTQLPSRFQQKTVVLPNAVWQREIAPRTSEPKNPNFLFVGSLERTHAWKGLAQIIDAVAIYKDQHGAGHLTVMGDGSARAAYEAQVEKLGLQREVTFLGAQRGEAKDQSYAAASALIVYPTTANDAFPTVMLEAWARGVPVLAAAIGPIPSLIEDGQTGMLIEAQKPEALVAAMHDFVQQTPAARQAMARTAAARTQAAYTWERQATAVAEITKELLS